MTNFEDSNSKMSILIFRIMPASMPLISAHLLFFCLCFVFIGSSDCAICLLHCKVNRGRASTSSRLWKTFLCQFILQFIVTFSLFSLQLHQLGERLIEAEVLTYEDIASVLGPPASGKSPSDHVVCIIHKTQDAVHASLNLSHPLSFISMVLYSESYATR